MKEDIREEIEIPDGITAAIEKGMLSIKGKKGESKRILRNPKIVVSKSGNNIIIESKNGTKRDKTLIGSLKAHIKNMVHGVQEGYKYKLKICSSHFPMNVSIANKEFIVKNFLGESIPRKFKLQEGASVKIEGAEVIVESHDKEIAGQTAASIEQLCRITDKDRRVFQDGIYITLKPGRNLNG